MLPISAFFPSHASQRPGSLLREIAPRSDRVPRDERVDLPEIQESSLVSFSEEARLQSLANPADRPPAHSPGLGPSGIEAYRRIAAM